MPRKYATEEEKKAARQKWRRAYGRMRRAEDPEGDRRKCRAYYAKNRERMRRLKLAAYYRDKERRLKRQKEYRKENREVIKISNALQIPMPLARKKLAEFDAR